MKGASEVVLLLHVKVKTTVAQRLQVAKRVGNHERLLRVNSPSRFNAAAPSARFERGLTKIRGDLDSDVRPVDQFISVNDKRAPTMRGPECGAPRDEILKKG